MSVEQVVTVKITCDGPPCQRGTAGPRTIEWTEARGVPVKPPNDAWRIIVVDLFDGSKHLFCGVECAITWLRKHRPLQSPSESADDAVLATAADGLAKEAAPTELSTASFDGEMVVEP